MVGLGLNLGLNPQKVGGGAGGVFPSGLILHLDARDATSYGGTGQTWTDISGNGDDYWLGIDGTTEPSNDPTFSGSAGDSAARFVMTNGNEFTQKVESDTYKNVANESAPQPFSVVTRTKFISGSGFFCGTGNITGKTWNFFTLGTDFRIFLKDGASSTNQQVLGNGTFVNDTEYLMAVTLDFGSNEGKLYLNSSTPQTFTLPAGYTGTGDGAFTLSAATGGTTRPTGTEYAAWQIYNKVLSDDEYTQISSAL